MAAIKTADKKISAAMRRKNRITTPSRSKMAGEATRIGFRFT
jgi:hypothetical protein